MDAGSSLPPSRANRVEGKRRAAANRIGTRGEAAFSYYATLAGLLPTKFQEDVGLDFICQVDENPASFPSSTIASAVIGVSVRSTSKVGGRIALDRSDAADLLRADFPVCVVLLEENGLSDTPWFASLDAGFRDQLLNFLASKRKTFTFTSNECRPWSDFRSWVDSAMTPGSAEQEKIKAAESRLEKSIANVKLEVRRDARGALTIVTAMDLYAYFSTLDDADRYKLYEATFGAAHRASSRVKSLALKKELVSELSHLPDPWVLGGFTYLNHSVLRVEGVAGSADCTFTKTSNGEHTGWCRGNGFSLTASKSKKEGSVWIHELAAFADPEEDLDLSTDEELLTFLNCCVPGARIGDPSPAACRLLVEEFGALSYYGWFSQYFNRAKNLSGWSAEVAVLRDAVDEETLNTMAWLAALSDMPTAVGKIAFSLESDSEPDPTSNFPAARPS